MLDSPKRFLKGPGVYLVMANELGGQECPLCHEKKLTLREEELDIPFFGQVYVFSMSCEGCHYRKSDLEAAETKEPLRYTLEVNGEADLNIRIVKSGEATVKIPQMITMEPGSTSDGYVTNVEGLLEKVKQIIQSAGEAEEDEEAQKKAKNMVKKLNNVLVGREPLKIILEDPSGNSAIISDKVVKTKLK